MLKSLALISLLATLPLANAQSADPAPQTAPQATPDQPQPPAPIVRHYQSRGLAMHPLHRQQPSIVESQPIPGVWLRSESTSDVKTISAAAPHAEISLTHGRLNVQVHQPAQHSEILIDLPGGQVSLLKDGLYTFNADTNTVRVLRGEAAAWSGPHSDAKPIKIKEDHQLSLVATAGAKPAELRSVEAYPYELTADLLPPSNDYNDAYGDGPDYPRHSYPGYGYSYDSGLWDYPYAYPGFYPYGYGYPFAYGIGFGYYGGFHGGYGYRGGFRR